MSRSEVPCSYFDLWSEYEKVTKNEELFVDLRNSTEIFRCVRQEYIKYIDISLFGEYTKQIHAHFVADK